MMRLVWRAAAVFGLAVVTTMVMAAQAPPPAPAPATTPATTQPALVALATLAPGLWQLDTKGQPSRQMCLADGTELIQLEHKESGCSRFVIANEAKSATVHYGCEGAGWGRTVVRVETAQLAQIQTQGISHNAPFEFSTQARRVGDCNATPAAH